MVRSIFSPLNRIHNIKEAEMNIDYIHTNLVEHKKTEDLDYFEAALEKVEKIHQNHNRTTESLKQAIDSLDFVKSDLLNALSSGSPVESIMIQSGLEKCADLTRHLKEFFNAMEAEIE
jgi:response regulator RpfG family c-di-GMP phosphodiesterase